jgi:hypothetical protein
VSANAFNATIEKGRADARAALEAEEHATEPISREWWDVKPCNRCGVQRKCRHHKWRSKEPTWNVYCTACKYELAAERHDELAANARAHARKERDKQKRQGLTR